LQTLYKKSKKKFDTDPAFREAAQRAVVLLQVKVALGEVIA
jgi:hypothetical protein